MTAPQTHKTKTYVLLFLLVLLGSVGNTILSKGMKDAGDLDISHVSSLISGATRVLTSGAIWIGIAMMLGFMVCHMLVLSWADYSFVMPFSAIAYALVPLLGYLFLHEQVSTARWIGIALIVFGVVLITERPTGPPRLEFPTDMRTASILLIVVVTGTGGEICLTHAMKLLGEVHDFHPRAIAAFLSRALRVGWLWFAVLLMAASFFSFLTMLSWFPVSFVIPATSLAYVAGAFGAKIFLGEKLNGTRWAGIFLICLGVAMAWVDDVPATLHYPSALTMVRWTVLTLALGPLFYYLIGIYSAWRFFRVAHRAAGRAPSAGGEAPAVSVLKPVRGLDLDAYENFASFCRQDYPEFEILFAVNDPDDPAVPVVQKLIADFPERSIRLIVVAERLGPNTKVSNLCRLVREARHDFLVITDSDVRVEPGYLHSVAAMFRDPGVGGVTALYRGRDNLQFVAAMDCVGSSAAFCGAALVARELEGLHFMMGSTMAVTKERLAEVGGFEAMVDLHSDDYELGHRIAARGYRIELLSEPVWMAFPSQTLGAYLRHELRWAIGIRNIRPGGHFGMLLTHGLPWAIAAAAVAPSAAVGAAYLSAYFILRFAMAWAVGVWGLRDPVLRRRIWLLPVRDLLSFFVWLASFGMNRIEWRGSFFTLEKGRMIPVAPRAGRG